MPTIRYCIQCGAEFSGDEPVCPIDGSPLRARASDDPLIGRVLAERYDILELLGVGGMGRVYVATHVALGRKSAVKVISPDYANSAEAITRFNREAANASRINHPNVAQVYDFGTTPDGTLYLAMEFIDGEPLSSVIERLGPLAVQRTAAITMQVAEGLAAAHQLGIVHRDLKPENIMIGRNLDGSDWVKIVDFGIAKTVESEQGSQTVTTAGVSIGTPDYMSPEQFAGERVDHRTDIYSLGLVVFNMLTGEMPYPTVTSKDTLVKRLTSKPRPLAEARPRTVWPSGLQTALDRALAPEANDRYHTVTDFGRDVVRVCTRTGAGGSSMARVRAVVAQTERTTPVNPLSVVSKPSESREPSQSADAASRRPARTKRSSDGRMSGWAAILIVLLAGGGAGAFVVTHPKEVLQLVGMVAKAAPDTTTRLDASVPVDTLPEVAVIPQGTGAVDTTSAPTAPAAVDSQAHTEPPPPVHVEPPASAHVEPGAAARIDPSVAARTDAAPSRSTPTPPPEKAHPVLPVGRARLTHAATDGDARDSTRAAQSRSAAAPPARDSLIAPPPNELHHPWLRANGDSTAARIIDNSSSPDERLQALIEEMQGHLAVGNRHTTRGDLARARRAYRDASEEGGVIKLTFPGALVSGRVDGILLNGMRQAFQLCQAARPDSTAVAGGECGSLFAR